MGTTKLTKLTNKSKRYESSATEVNPLRQQNSQRLSRVLKMWWLWCWCRGGGGRLEEGGSGSRRVSRTDAWGAKKLTETKGNIQEKSQTKQ